MESVVVEGNNDLLMSILVRLPPKPVFRFRCVSKRWNNIIANPYFLKSYSAITRKHPPRGQRQLGFIQLTGKHITLRTNLESYNIKLVPSQLVPSKLGKFINSSNGLILCGEHSSNTYHVWNPLTKKSVSLPPPKIPYSTYGRISIGLVCKENTNELVPNYTVLRGGIRISTGARDTTMDIETYSSRTGTWAMSTLVSTGDFLLYMEPPPLVFNGVVHWRGCKSIALHNPNGGDNHLQLIMLPLPHDGQHYDSSFTRSEHDDVLWYGHRDIHHKMQIWMLPKNNNDGRSYRRSTTIPANEGSLMHKIKLLGNNIEMNRILEPIWLEGLIPCNPLLLVLRVEERVFIYNLEIETKSIESIQYDNGGRPTKWWYPYMESPYLSSYALRG